MIPPSDVRELTVRDYLNIVLKRLWIVVGLLVAAVIFLVLFYFLHPKTYIARTTILIRSGALKLMDPKMDPLSGGGKQSYRSQVSLLRSNFLAERVIRKLELDITQRKLLAMLSVSPIHKTSMAVVALSGSDPVWITDVANTWVREYIYQDMERKMGVAQYGISRLESQISESLANLQQSERKFHIFIKKYGNLADRQRDISRLKDKQRSLEGTIVAKSAMFKDKHYKMINLHEQLKKIKEKVELQTELLLGEKGGIVEYNVLKKDVEVDKATYGDLVLRHNNLNTARGLAVSDIRVIDVAQVPKKAEPFPFTVILGGFAAAIGIGVLICFIMEHLDSSMKAPEEVEFYLKIPCLGRMPLAGDRLKKEGVSDLNLTAHVKPYSQIAESSRNLKASLVFSFDEKTTPKTILVTSAVPGEGKTFITSNMGIIFAREEKPVLIVDVDMRSRRLTRSFKAIKNKGLSSVLKGDASLEDVQLSTAIPNLFLLPAGPFARNPAALLETDKFDHILKEIAQKYYMVLLDLPAVSTGPESLILGDKCDLSILVIKEGHTSLNDINTAKKNMEGRKAKIAGAILNDAEMKSNVYGYYHHT